MTNRTGRPNKIPRITPSEPDISVWCMLMNSDDGKPFKIPIAFYVSVTLPARVDRFLEAVRAAWAEEGIFKGIPVPLLRVYPNKNEFDRRRIGGTPLSLSFHVNELGKKESDPIIVAVPLDAAKESESFVFTSTRPIPETVPHIKKLRHPFCVTYEENEEIRFAYENVPATLPKRARPEIEIPYNFLIDAGILNSCGVHEGDRCFWETEFIIYDVIERGKVGYIQGHPITALTTAAALCRDEKWNVLWCKWRASPTRMLTSEAGQSSW